MYSAARLIIVAVIISCAAGCTTASHEADSPVADFTQDMAKSMFEKVVTGVAENGVADFCSRHVRSTGTCTSLLNDALRRCLLPGDRPQVKRVAHIPPQSKSEGGWMLEVHGRTMDGQQYVSEFFAVRPENESPQAAYGIYWTGLDIEGSPFGPNNTKVPQNACPGR